MKYKFTIKDSLKFGWEGIEGFSYNEKEHFRRASTAVFHVTKNHGKVKNLISDRIYYILEGQGLFIINDEEIKVNKSDVIIVPRNTFYDYSGKMKLFLVHTPAYDEKNEVHSN